VSSLLALSASAASAQAAPVTRDSVTLTPGPQFSTTSWIRWLGTPMFGSRYRDLWRTPMTLPLLDLAATAGGMVVSGHGVGTDAGLVYLAGADGSHWTFYPLDRPEPHSFPAGVVPEAVSEGLVADLVSGRNPAGPLVAAALAEAAGVPNQDAWLVAVPAGAGLQLAAAGDSARAGYLIRGDPVPTTDSTGPVRDGTVLTALTFLHRILARPAERIDARAALLATLFNAYVGNLDPRFLEWRWQASVGDAGVLWRPLGLFRATALSKYNGIVSSAWRPLAPDLVNFGRKYPHAVTGNSDQQSGYRLLVGSLGRSTWDSVATMLQARLTDSAISAAVARMPPAYQARIGTEIAGALRDRRDRLSTLVDRMYRQVRQDAEIFATAESERVVLQWAGRDSLAVRVGTRHPAPFLARETDRVTLFLGTGTDTLEVVGTPGKAPAVRVAPLPGESLFVTGSGDQRALTIFGKSATVTTDRPGDTRIRSGTLADPLAFIDTTGEERSDVPRTYHPTGWLALTSGVGLLIGGGVVRTDWSGDARPYRNRLTLRAAYGSDSKKGVVELLGDFRFAGSPLQLQVQAVASGVGAVYFYGYGNETPGDSANAYYRAGRNLYGLAPTLLLPLSDKVKVGVGLDLKSVNTPLDSSLYIGIAEPYGSPDFGQAGFTGAFVVDTRDVRGAPRRGVLASVTGGWYPWVKDGSGDFTTVSGSLATYLTPGWWPAMTVATRVGGTTTAGSVPYYQAAFVGGGRTVRGLPQGRYEGDHSLYGNLDLRLRVTQIQFVLPWDFGVLGLADAGRVWVTGEPSTVWHPSFGGGLWAALLDRSLAASLTVAGGAGQGIFINALGGFTF
jgi:hypothetical protein